MGAGAALNLNFTDGASFSAPRGRLSATIVPTPTIAALPNNADEFATKDLPHALRALQRVIQIDPKTSTAAELSDSIRELWTELHVHCDTTSHYESMLIPALHHEPSLERANAALDHLTAIKQAFQALEREVRERVMSLEPDPEKYQAYEREIAHICDAERKLSTRKGCAAFLLAGQDLSARGALGGEKRCLTLLDNFLGVAYGFAISGQTRADRCDYRNARWMIDHIPPAVRNLVTCRDVATTAERSAEDVRLPLIHAIAAFRDQLRIEQHAAELAQVIERLNAEEQFPMRQEFEAIFGENALPQLVDLYVSGLENELQKDFGRIQMNRTAETLLFVTKLLYPIITNLSDSYAAEKGFYQDRQKLDALISALAPDKEGPRALLRISREDPEFHGRIVAIAADSPPERRQELATALSHASRNWTRLAWGTKAAARQASDLFVEVIKLDCDG